MIEQEEINSLADKLFEHFEDYRFTMIISVLRLVYTKTLNVAFRSGIFDEDSINEVLKEMREKALAELPIDVSDEIYKRIRNEINLEKEQITKNNIPVNEQSRKEVNELLEKVHECLEEPKFFVSFSALHVVYTLYLHHCFSMNFFDREYIEELLEKIKKEALEKDENDD